MTDMKEIQNRRNHPRFRVQEGAYAVLNNGAFKIGQIQNISKGGLALRYLAMGEKAEESYQVDIFVKDNDFFLTKIPFKTISDVDVNFEIPFSTTSMRQCGGQFGELTQRQAVQLDYFINSYTLSEA